MATITLPDEVAGRLTALAARMYRTPTECVAAWLEYAEQVANGDEAASAVTLDNLQWDLEMVSPKGLATLNRLTEEALEQEARGEVEEGGFDGR